MRNPLRWLLVAGCVTGCGTIETGGMQVRRECARRLQWARTWPDSLMLLGLPHGNAICADYLRPTVERPLGAADTTLLKPAPRNRKR